VSKFSEHKAAVISIAISVAAFCVFLLVFKYIDYMEQAKLSEGEHEVIQALFSEDKILMYEKSIIVPELSTDSGITLSAAFEEEFATEECLINANSEALEIENELLSLGNITVFDDDWIDEASQIDGFQQTLFAEGYFGVFRVSRPCYNTERNKVIIYYEQDCGLECGNGEVALLALKDGTWQRQQKRIIWVD
jgi:hypothetical protein